MSEYTEQVDALASLMEEFRLEEATLTLSGFKIAFRRSSPRVSVALPTIEADADAEWAEELPRQAPQAAPVAKGTPVASPMNGIYYNAPSPSSPPFVKVGDTVTAGQIIGLIEAMKVFNEIPCPISGTVLELVAEPGAIVQPGDSLLLIG